MTNQSVILSSVAPIHKQPTFTSEMISQALMWESVKIIETYKNWHQIKMEDGYDGWIHSFYIVNHQSQIYDHIFVTNRVVPVFDNIDKLDNILVILSYGTCVPVVETMGDFFEINLPDGKIGYIEKQKQFPDKNRDTIMNLSKSLLSVPYLWGGKSSFGYDCSGFVQMVLKTMGIYIQRDTSLQIKTKKLRKIDPNDGQPGDLLFFSENNQTNHVAFFIGEGKIIHSSGHVKIESIIEGGQGFSKQLSLYEKTAMSISSLISS